MRPYTLPKGAVRKIHEAVDLVFDRVKARFLERPPTDRRIVIGFTPRVTLPSLFEAASMEERARADKDLLGGLLRIAEGYVEAQRHATKSQVVKAVEAFLGEARAKGVETDVQTVLGGELAEVFGRAQSGMKRILDAEASNVRNTGTLGGILRVNAATGVDDPVVYFVVVRDGDLCGECRRLHLMPDGTTPRLWRLSEVKQGYHKRGEEQPAIGGLHPHCRCSLVTLMPGYGFDGSGSVEFKELDHDEFARQRR